MEVTLDWTCPICGHIQDNVAYVTPCHHQLCYGCALWWAKKQQKCAVCGHKIRTIRYSERSDDDYLSALPCSPQHAQVMAHRASRSLQSRCCCLLSTAFLLRSGLPFSNNTREISALFQWLHQEIRGISADRWWEVLARTGIIMNLLCRYGLHEAVLLRELQPSLRGLTVRFVRRLLIVAAALCGPEIRRQRDHGDTGAAGGRENGPAAARSPTASQRGPPACGPGRFTGSAAPGDLCGGPGNLAAAAPSEKEPGQAAAAGPCTRGRHRSRGGRRAAPKRKAGSSPRHSPLPRKRRPRR